MTAEPPVPPPDKNPFSFKNFVSRRVQGEDEDVIKVKKAPKKAKGKHTDPAVPFPEVGDPKNGTFSPSPCLIDYKCNFQGKIIRFLSRNLHQSSHNGLVVPPHQVND